MPRRQLPRILKIVDQILLHILKLAYSWWSRWLQYGTVDFRSDLRKFEYLTMCIKESMRLHCPVPFIGRVTTKEINLSGDIIPPGTQVLVNLWFNIYWHTVFDWHKCNVIWIDILVVQVVNQALELKDETVLNWASLSCIIMKMIVKMSG